MTSILFLLGNIQRNQFRCNYKKNPFSQFISAFLISRSNFEHFEEKMFLRASMFSELRNPKNVVRQMSKNFRFRRLFERQHGKRSEALLRSAPQLICWSLWTKLNWKNLVLVISKTLGLFVNTLATDNLWTPKNMVRKYLKRFVSEDPLTSNMVNGPKHC